MRRVVRPELLDVDAGTPAEIAASLADLRRVNRWFGGIATTVALVRRVAQERRRAEFSLLEVAAASGDVALAARQRLRREGIRLDLTLLDRSPSHLLAADRRAMAANGARRLVGDALALPFADASFDLVSCALFLHHLQPADFAAFMREALRVCRIAVLINDLRRSALSLALVYAGFPLFRSRLTRHDGPVSVRRAYTAAELQTMLACSPAQRVEITPHYLFRMGVIVWK